jgi:hypothetical protein
VLSLPCTGAAATNHDNFRDGTRLLGLSEKAYFLFEKQNPTEKLPIA